MDSGRDDQSYVVLTESLASDAVVPETGPMSSRNRNT